MSSGSPRRFIGTRLARSSPKFSTRKPAKSVFTRPGAIPTTRVGRGSARGRRAVRDHHDRWIVRLSGPRDQLLIAVLRNLRPELVRVTRAGFPRPDLHDEV